MRAGDRFDEGDVVDRILDGRAVALSGGSSRATTRRLGYAVWYHGRGRRLSGVTRTTSGRSRVDENGNAGPWKTVRRAG